MAALTAGQVASGEYTLTTCAPAAVAAFAAWLASVMYECVRPPTGPTMTATFGTGEAAARTTPGLTAVARTNRSDEARITSLRMTSSSPIERTK